MAAPSKEEKLEARVAELEKQLADEQTAHGSTKADFENAFGELKSASSTIEALRQQLADEVAAHESTKADLASREQGAALSVEGSQGPELVAVTDKKTGMEHELPQRVLDELGAQGKKQFSQKVDKPADLQ